MRSVGVVVHPTRPVGDALETVRRWTDAHGLELVQVSAGDRQPHVEPSGDVATCELIAAIGGDGTILQALHAAASTHTPVLGVAYGSLGALTTIPADALTDGLDRFAAGDWSPRRLAALHVETPDGPFGYGINDLVLVRRGGTQLVVEVSVDEDLYVRLAGDGVVVATALGSSAYSMAAGGPLLSAGAGAFVCTPLAMHGGCAPPLIVPSGRTVTLTVDQGHGGCEVEIDGQRTQAAAPRLLVTLQADYATLVALDDPDTGLPGLRERGLIVDSPRVLARDRRLAASGTATAPPA